MLLLCTRAAFVFDRVLDYFQPYETFGTETFETTAGHWALADSHAASTFTIHKLYGKFAPCALISLTHFLHCPSRSRVPLFALARSSQPDFRLGSAPILYSALLDARSRSVPL